MGAGDYSKAAKSENNRKIDTREHPENECQQDKRLTLLAVLFLLTVLGSLGAAAAPSPTSSLAIRGTLPWHNFLSGPTAWDEEDYVRYLDRLKELGLNYVAFHCYTGGAERYGPYVEPLIKVSYRDVLPEAGLDTSLTARWGYRPLRVTEFAFGTADLFKLPAGAEAFGARAAILARSNAERYANAQALMRRVIGLAHERGIQVGLGFEFGIHEQQMVAIGRGLMARLKILMLDEPSLGLAPLLIKDIFETVRQIAQQGTTVLMVEQDVKHSLSLSDRGYVLEHGRALMEGPARELLENPHIKTAYSGL